MILIKSFQVEFLESLLIPFASFFKSVDHFLMVASTLYLVSGINELTHLNIKALSLAHVREQFVCLTDQKEVIVELFFRAPMRDSFLTCLSLHQSSTNYYKPDPEPKEFYIDSGIFKIMRRRSHNEWNELACEGMTFKVESIRIQSLNFLRL